MFDDLKNLNLGEMMNKARQMQEKMATMQQELAQKQVTADAGGGMVQATVNGRMELVKLHINREKVDLNDLEMLEDVIVAAIAAAQRRAGEMLKQEMERAAGAMGLPPGLLPG